MATRIDTHYYEEHKEETNLKETPRPTQEILKENECRLPFHCRTVIH
jgi:hypothetical protein